MAALLDSLKNKLKKAGKAADTVKNDIKKASSNFFTQKVVPTVNTGLDLTFNTKNPNSLNSRLGQGLTSTGTYLNRELANPENPIFGGNPLAQSVKKKQLKKYLDYGTITREKYNEEIAKSDFNMVAGVSNGVGSVSRKAAPAIERLLAKATPKGEVKVAVDQLIKNLPKGKQVQMLSDIIEKNTGPKATPIDFKKLDDIYEKATPKLVHTQKLPTNSTPINTNKLENIYAKNAAQKEIDDVNRVVDNMKFGDAKPPKGTFTKLNTEALETGYRNIASGLPPAGLPAESLKKANVFVGGLKDWAVESGKVLKSYGRAGRILADRSYKALDEGERAAGSAVRKVEEAIGKIKPEDFEAVSKGLRGEVSGLPENNGMVKAIRKVLDDVVKEAEKVGIKVNYREGYYPQLADKAKLSAMRDQAAKHFVDTKQFETYDDAIGFIDRYLDGEPLADAYNQFAKKAVKKSSNLEFERVLDWLPDVLRNDREVLAEYLTNAYRRISTARQFGAKNEIADNLLEQLRKQGYDINRAKEIVDKVLERAKANPKAEQVGGLVRTAQAVVKLPLAAITNATQNTQTVAAFGPGRTLKEVSEYFLGGKNLKEMKALETGATLESTLKEIADQWKGTNMISKIAAPFFKNVEKFNRVIAANTGIRAATEWFEALKKSPADEALIRKLQELGINPAEALQRGILTNDELMRAGQKAVNRTQFKTRPIDLPKNWSSPAGKVMTQFKTFGFKQSQFIRDELLVPLIKQKNPVPLVTYLLVGGLVTGELSNDIKSVINQRERPDNLLARFGENVMSTGAGGLYYDALKSLSYGGSGLVDVVGGPTAGDIYDTVENTSKLAKGNPLPFVRQSVQNIPFIGKPIVNTNKDIFYKENPQPKKLDELFASSSTGELTPTSDVTGTTPLDEIAVDEQIKALQDEQKSVAKDSGFNIPLVNKKIGGKSDAERNKKLTELQNTEKELKEKKKYIGSDEEDRIKADFKKSGKSIMEKDGKVYRLNKSGEVSILTKDAYDESLYQSKMTTAKKNENFEEWTKLADKRYEKLLALIDDPDLDELERNNYQNEIDTLISDYQKYATYGGFKKGGSGSAANKTLLKALTKKSSNSGRSSKLLRLVLSNKGSSKKTSKINDILKSKRLKVSDKPKI